MTSAAWRDAEGYPSDAYLLAVEQALTETGITVSEVWRNEPWDFVLRLGEAEANRLGYAQVFVAWTIDQHCDPRGDVIRGPGWHWVPYTDPSTALGDFAAELPVEVFADPRQVAAAVAALLNATV
ncbi:hypothetical protein ACSNOI_43230 [Actinomadura kijaniata]|uniref:hypothetical protein n=1 Tax=Actinomadura kijaniata TaxID=46161 RepID=UPI003F1B2F91